MTSKVSSRGFLFLSSRASSLSSRTKRGMTKNGMTKGDDRKRKSAG
ncbi:hypothetical protein MYX06_04990 [Patescibacteria group bacterium AH-259-L05]|nr:hypothetical protein [Patescibacteria group bacterium AH-259-L05]